MHKVNQIQTDHTKSKPVLILGFRKPFLIHIEKHEVKLMNSTKSIPGVP